MESLSISTPTSMMLDTDPAANSIMLSVLDEGKDVNYVAWDGDSWGTVSEHETDAGQSNGQPFLFLWDVDTNDAPEIASWYDNNWLYRKEIVIDAEDVTGGLTDFPVLIYCILPLWKQHASLYRACTVLSGDSVAPGCRPVQA